MPLPIAELTIGRFRGLRDLSLQGLGRVNILLGRNNSGKTSVLEALSLAANPLDPVGWTRIATRRDPFGFALRAGFLRLRWLFPHDMTTDPLSNYDGHVAFSLDGGSPFRVIQAQYRDLRSLRAPAKTSGPDVAPEDPDLAIERRGARLDVEVTYRSPVETKRQESFTWWEDERFEVPRMAPAVSIPTQVVTPYDHLIPVLLAQQYSEARRGNNADAINELLAFVDPRITGLEVLAAPDAGQGRRRSEAVLYIRDRSAGLLPLDAFGDGIRRILLIAFAITLARGGMLLVDELETAIHISALARAFRWMVSACKDNRVQLFVTTHSLEAIDALLAADDTPADEDIVGYRLEANAQTITARRYGEDLLRRLRMERGLEVR